MAVSTITYLNKSAINENADVADTNKVKASDMNEIKTVVNNNANILSGLTGTMLWTNPDPTSSIPTATTITLNTDDYDLYEVIYTPSYTSNIGQLMSTGLIPKGSSSRMQMSYWGGSSIVLRDRALDYISDTSFQITESLASDGDYVCRPIYIIGFKTGLF